MQVCQTDTMDAIELLKRYKAKQRDFQGVDLEGINLRKATLMNINLSGANLSNANLFLANLSGANLAQADLIKADLFGVNLICADLSGAELIFVNLIQADLSGVNLICANLAQANLSGANLGDANLAQANLAGANLIQADLRGANLSGANLSQSNLAYAQLNYADLHHADLTDANLAGTDFTDALLNEANLKGTILQPMARNYEFLPHQRFMYWKQQLSFHSHPELEIAKALDRAGVLYFPSSLARICTSEGPKNKEPDFLVCCPTPQGFKWGIIEVDNLNYTPEQQTEEQQWHLLFQQNGVPVYRFDWNRCENEPEDVVREFLQLLNDW
ncbi:MAG: pentapeptide repeat-containing protein [Hormoscilla sp.]